MAKATNSQGLAVGALVGGLCIGAAGMSTAIESEYWPSGQAQTKQYQLRSDLSLLEASPRIETALFARANQVPVRESDSLQAPEALYPVRLVIESIGVDTQIASVGIEPTTPSDTTPNSAEQTTVAIPGVDEAGWYKFGASPGQPGATVLAGHVDLAGLEGVFWSLDELQPGALVEVHLSDGSIANYRVMRGTDFSRDALPSDELFRQAGAPALHLITCGGAFNENLGRYESNYVVTAAPIYDNA